MRSGDTHRAPKSKSKRRRKTLQVVSEVGLQIKGSTRRNTNITGGFVTEGDSWMGRKMGGRIAVRK